MCGLTMIKASLLVGFAARSALLHMDDRDALGKALNVCSEDQRGNASAFPPPLLPRFLPKSSGRQDRLTKVALARL